MISKEYDYIFLGAGCASLSIIMRMIDSKKFIQKKILLLEKKPKIKNDRTWCFWEREKSFFEDIVFKKWSNLFFKTGTETVNLAMEDYQYKMVRGIDFYNKCFSLINKQENIDVVYGQISFETDEYNLLKIKIDNEEIIPGGNTIVFNSIITKPKQLKDNFYLLQHFKGWIIETEEDFFNAGDATLMDFSVAQTHGTTFVYVLPLSSKKALVEYTVFSEKLLDKDNYDIALTSYLNKLPGLKNYKIEEEEFGIIPMNNASYPFYKNGMYFIGTAGGQTKPSTGYTFRFIQKQSEKIVEELISKGTLSKERKMRKRFFFYDSTLLHILAKNLLPGKTIFSFLFKKNKASRIFKFLDNETSVAEEIKLLNSLPKKVFIKAGFAEFKKIFFVKKKA
ncbi:MAG: lycopene cyclase family protein [Bacteroidota bacterium]|nr:lycopene cyclase family protein [Bacteroidota bacterium]